MFERMVFWNVIVVVSKSYELVVIPLLSFEVPSRGPLNSVIDSTRCAFLAGDLNAHAWITVFSWDEFSHGIFHEVLRFFALH